MMNRLKTVTVRLDEDLHQTIIDISQLTGRTIREIIALGLRKEIEQLMLKQPLLEDAIKKMNACRKEKINDRTTNRRPDSR